MMVGIRELKKRTRYFLHGDKTLPGYAADGLRTTNKNTSFMDEPQFAAAWTIAEEGNRRPGGSAAAFPMFAGARTRAVGRHRGRFAWKATLWNSA